MTLQKFSIEAVRNRDDRTRVMRRKGQLIEQYLRALGSPALEQHQRVERAAELVSLLELAWVNGGSADAAPEEEGDFIRLSKAASEAVTKLSLPAVSAVSIDSAPFFDAAVDGLLSKSAGPLGVTLF